MAGALMFKEKLNKIQIWGVIVGLLAIVVTGCGEFLWNLMY
jgi:EamA domain-containing membrane protein RarD